MKKGFSSFMGLLLAFMILSGCQKNDTSEMAVAKATENKKPQTCDQPITTLLRQGSLDVGATTGGIAGNNNRAWPLSFKLLSYAVSRAGLEDDLEALSHYTLFAPTDQAFREAGFKNEKDLDALPVATLQQVLLYHILLSKVPAASVPKGPNAPVPTANKLTLYVSAQNGGVTVNGGKVVGADIMASDGIIHAINKVLMPPAGSITDIVVNNPNFSLLEAAVIRAGLAGALSGGTFTVFAPTNKAFEATPFNSISAINMADPGALAKVLLYHAIDNRIFLCDLTNGLQPKMFGGGTTTISLNGVPRIKGTSNKKESKIIQADILATNGVIHVIDQVLLPQ